MHYSLLDLLLKNGDFLNTDISQGSVATRLGCGGVFKYDFVTNFLLSLTVKGQYLVKLWARVRCLVFFDSQCTDDAGNTTEENSSIFSLIQML